MTKKQTKSGKVVLTDAESKTESDKEEVSRFIFSFIDAFVLGSLILILCIFRTEQVKDNAGERKRQALEMLREKRSKRRNDGTQTTNVAPDQFDSMEAQNDFSETLPTVNLGSEPLLQSQTSSTPSVNVSDNTRKSTLETPVKYFRRKKIHQRKIFKTPLVSATLDSDLQIIEVREETHFEPLEIVSIAVSLPSSLKEELIKDDFIYVPLETSDNDSPPKEQQQPCQEALVARELEEEAQPDFAARPRQWEDDVPSFSLGISPLASQPTPPSQMTVTQPSQPSEPTISELEILEEAVVDAKVTAALKFAEATTAEPSFTAAEVYKTPEKDKEITEELKEKCYHWITHLKQTKDSKNEYDPVFILRHEVLFEGLRHHFMSLMPGEHVESTVVNTHCMIVNDMKCPRFEKDIYCVPTDIVMFMLHTNSDFLTKENLYRIHFCLCRFAMEGTSGYGLQMSGKRHLINHYFMVYLVLN
ncbi:uncharacterized protein DS421_12g375020 [Arachis hypogaea]|nr:uncharacterized protein DS421_12g375020 [Arachis hypogaea]